MTETFRPAIILLARLPIGITSGTGSHEPRMRGTVPSHAQSLRHCPSALPALRAQQSYVLYEYLRCLFLWDIFGFLSYQVVIAISVYAFYMQFYCHQVTSRYQR
jgi:hypothetical protein